MFLASTRHVRHQAAAVVATEGTRVQSLLLIQDLSCICIQHADYFTKPGRRHFLCAVGWIDLEYTEYSRVLSEFCIVLDIKSLEKLTSAGTAAER